MTKQKNTKKSSTKPIPPKYKKTIVVNLLAGPGAGKSTMAAALFSKLKWMGIECELASEFAKDLVWEKRDKTFENQIYIFGKQHHRIFRLMGQVQVIITDSPLLLTPIYDSERRNCLRQLVFNEVGKCNNLNILVERRKDYNPNGRIHTKSQAKKVDDTVEKFLIKTRIDFKRVEGTPAGVDYVTKYVTSMLKKIDEISQNETRRSHNRRV